MTDREDNAMGLALCMMALGGLSGGCNMGKNMSFVGMQNAVQANHSALWAMQMGTQQVNRMANCQTVNPLCRAMEQSRTCGTCKSWDIGSPTLCGKFSTSNLVYNCSFGGHPYWEPKQEPRQIIVDYGEDIDNAPTNILTLKTLYQEDERGNLADMQEDIDLVKQQLKHKIEELQYRTEVCKVPRFTPVFSGALASSNRVTYKPPEPRLTLDDLYNLAFPVDPIRDYFEGVCEQIDAAHEKRMEILDRVEVVPVERVEIVEPVESKNKRNAPAAVRRWLNIEKHIAAASWKTFLISATLRALTELFESGAASAVEYIGIMAVVNASLFLIFSAISVPVFVLVCIVREKMFKLERG